MVQFKAKVKPQRVRCPYCKVKKPISQFTENKLLYGGVRPWCIECIEKVKVAKDIDALNRYQRDYQKLYQKQYRLERYKPKRRNREGIVRLTSAYLINQIRKLLTLSELRQAKVVLELSNLIPRLHKTRQYEYFLANTCEHLGQETGAKVKPAELIPILPLGYYPELIFCWRNYRTKSIKYGVRTNLNEEDIQKSITILRKAITEVIKQ